MPRTAPPPDQARLQPFRLEALTPLNHEVLRLELSQIDGPPLTYREGQFVTVRLPDGTARSYSPAAACQGDGRLELHIRTLPGGRFSTWLRSDAGRSGALLDIGGPYGDCVWTPPATAGAPLLLLATGTGIAPIRAMLVRHLAGAGRHPVHLYWGGLDQPDLYLSEEFAALAHRHAHFRYTPVLAAATEPWRGRRGYVQAAAADDLPRLDGARVIACGSPAMVDAARTLLVAACGLAPDAFHADAFVAQGAAPMPSGDASLSLEVGLPQAPARRLAAPPGGTVLNTLAAAGLLQGVCGGQAACGTCRIGIAPAWRAALPPPGRKEARLLAALGSGPEQRLACQICLEAPLDGLRIELP
ncbi:FAD-binding oxidoreductase [Zoogloea sp.]|uniref:FAD-binding oxidoreductase n=1 Tax=Zoogloea sp. TaxID=49181 RepID=UPI001416D642|nr:MAG: 2Fe-2S iron-sulfur cluster binding domain-containing protein [Zoogloea sp.]